MSEVSDSLSELFSQMRERVRERFQSLRIKLNQREQELAKRLSELETSLRSRSEGLLSDLEKLQRTQSVLEKTLDSQELAGTQEATLSLIQDKISLLEASYAGIRSVATIRIDTGPLEALVSSLGELSHPGDARDPSPPPVTSLRVRRSHTPDPYTPRAHTLDRPTRYSQQPDSLHSRSDRATSLYSPSDSFLSRTADRVPRTISESGHGYMTPQPAKKPSGIIAKIGKSKK